MLFRFLITIKGKVPEKYRKSHLEVISQLEKGVYTPFTEYLLRDLLTNEQGTHGEEKVQVPEFLIDQVTTKLPPENVQKCCTFPRSIIVERIRQLDEEIFQKLFKGPEISVISFGAPRFFPIGAATSQRVMIPETYCFELCKDPIPQLFAEGTFGSYLFGRNRFKSLPIGQIIIIETPSHIRDPHGCATYLDALSTAAEMKLYGWALNKENTLERVHKFQYPTLQLMILLARYREMDKEEEERKKIGAQITQLWGNSKYIIV
jgi:hypothetical protein